MYRFNVTSVRRTPNGLQTREGVLRINKDQIVREDNNWVINLQYGYEYHFGNLCREGSDSATPGKTYRLMHQWMPHENDQLIDMKSGRKFKVGEVTGFVVYRAALFEGSKIVAFLKFESYYKD